MSPQRTDHVTSLNKLPTLWFVFAVAWITAVDAAAQQDPAQQHSAQQDSAQRDSARSNPTSLDRVWLEPRETDSEGRWYAGTVEVIGGKVIDFDTSQLRIMPSGTGSEMRIAASRVLWIEPSEVPELQRQAMRLYRDEKYAESLAKLPEILQQRPAVWRQQWITMLAANAAWKSGRNKIALELVGQLDRRPLPPMVIAWLPIAWRGGVQPVGAVAEAQQRLSDSSPAVQLVAASWLLSSPQRREATLVLRKLTTHSRAAIASLAGCLLWRIAPPPQVVDSAREWEATLEALPMVLQTGPTRTLADRLRTAGLSDDADRLDWSIDLVPIHPHP